MKTIRSDEEAVSPVIGVILMVAIVVILAAVIAAFVFGMAGSAGTSKNIGMTVTKNGTSGFEILWQGGNDINGITGVDWNVVGGNTPGNGTVTLTNTPPQVGDVDAVAAGDITGGRLLITATFTDGSDQVIFDRRY